jgi:hypothetical protein
MDLATILLPVDDRVGVGDKPKATDVDPVR